MKIDGRQIEISNREKLLFPDAGLTKGDLVEYYRRIADVMVPHLAERPLTLYRFPEGVNAPGFYQKNVSEYFPDWIPRVRLGRGGNETEYCICNDAATLVYLAGQVFTPHIWLSRVDKPEYPDRLIFDLDPPDDNQFDLVRSTAQTLGGLLLDIGIVSFPMTTGSRGLHIVVPLDRRADFTAVRRFAGDVAAIVASQAPDRLTTEIRKDKRGGRLFLDSNRNGYAQTGVAPYAVRAKPGAPIATPLEWDEIDDAKLRSNRYHIKNIFRRLGQKPDPWEQINRHPVNLEAHRQRLDRLQKRLVRRRA